MTVKEMIEKYLRDNGFDGLCNDDCGCPLDDLMPCCDSIEGCVPGYKVPCDCGGGCDYHISENMEQKKMKNKNKRDWVLPPEMTIHNRALSQQEINKHFSEFKKKGKSKRGRPRKARRDFVHCVINLPEPLVYLDGLVVRGGSIEFWYLGEEVNANAEHG